MVDSGYCLCLVTVWREHPFNFQVWVWSGCGCCKVKLLLCQMCVRAKAAGIKPDQLGQATNMLIWVKILPFFPQKIIWQIRYPDAWIPCWLFYFCQIKLQGRNFNGGDSAAPSAMYITAKSFTACVISLGSIKPLSCLRLDFLEGIVFCYSSPSSCTYLLYFCVCVSASTAGPAWLLFSTLSYN